MQQAELWLPGFEFGDALLGAPPQPDYVLSESLPTGETNVQDTSTIETLASLDASTSDDFVDDPESTIETVAPPSLIAATAAAAKQTELAAPPWPQLTPMVHDGLKGQVTKFDANVQAIELLRQLESEQSQPSDEQRLVLNRYTGWGGIKHPFDSWPGTDWINRKQQLTKLLSDDEFESARGSTLNAHFTPISIIDQLWATLRRIGFNGGRIVEPAGGVGFMIGAMPSDIAQRSSVTTVELDNLSARFLKTLYGNHATVHHMGFEKANLPDEYYDLVVSNVPFGRYSVGDVRRKVYSNWSIHNYYVGRALDLVRPGGLVAVITSAFFMDADSETVRDVIARKAKLLGAVRFPAGTFTDIANTDVVADLVILQKRTAGDLLTPEERALWIETSLLLDANGVPMRGGHYQGAQRVNNYWQAKPTAVAGTWSATSRNQGLHPGGRQGHRHAPAPRCPSRMGATDVVPFVPVEGVSMEDCAELARRLGKRVAAELAIPVYLYEAAASRPERRNLADVRRGEYEGLVKKLQDPQWQPDSWRPPRPGGRHHHRREFPGGLQRDAELRQQRPRHRHRLRAAREGPRGPPRPREALLPGGRADLLCRGRLPLRQLRFTGATFQETMDHCGQAHDYDLPALMRMNDVDPANPVGQKVRRRGIFDHCKAIG